MKNGVAIIDYGASNLQSVKNIINHLGHDAFITRNPKDIADASAIILPGVGAFHEAIANLYRLNLVECLNQEVLEKRKNILGICLGMQLLFESSDENNRSDKGLCWLPGKTVKIGQCNMKLPHVGWNEVYPTKESALFQGLGTPPIFYFDHSYHVECSEEYTLATSRFGECRIVVAVEYKNIFGVQFHPEKSQREGMQIIHNFLNFTNKAILC